MTPRTWHDDFRLHVAIVQGEDRGVITVWAPLTMDAPWEQVPLGRFVAEIRRTDQDVESQPQLLRTDSGDIRWFETDSAAACEGLAALLARFWEP